MITIDAILLLALIITAFLQQPSFGRQPSGERLERIKRSPNYFDGQFKNLESTELMTGEKSRWKSLWEFISSDRSALKPDHPIPAMKTDLKAIPKDSNLMVWFGHSSYLLQINDKRILADPVFYSAAPVSFINKPFEGTDIYKPEDMPEIDYLMISHDHWDHLDYKTVKELKKKTGKVICPLGVGSHFERWGYDKKKLVELDWYESIRLDSSFTVHCMPARHFSGRGLKSNKTLWASYLIDAGTLKVYMGGDSGYGIHFKEIGDKYPGIDWAILENGQYSKNWKYIHTMPEQLHRAAKDLKAKNIVTVHHSKYSLSDFHRWDEPTGNAERLRRDTTLHVAIPKIGEVFPLTAE